MYSKKSGKTSEKEKEIWAQTASEREEIPEILYSEVEAVIKNLKLRERRGSQMNK